MLFFSAPALRNLEFSFFLSFFSYSFTRESSLRCIHFMAKINSSFFWTMLYDILKFGPFLLPPNDKITTAHKPYPVPLKLRVDSWSFDLLHEYLKNWVFEKLNLCFAVVRKVVLVIGTRYVWGWAVEWSKTCFLKEVTLEWMYWRIQQLMKDAPLREFTFAF